MQPTEILTVTALALNGIALVVVAYQTYLTGRSVTASNRSLQLSFQSIQLSTRTMQVAMLPNANWVVNVRTDMERWIADLRKVVEECRAATENKDAERLKAVANRGLHTPRGLVSSTEHTPDWVTTIWLAGAQYYYDAKSPQLSLWSHSADSPWFEFVPNFIQRCDDSIRGLEQLLDLVDGVVPEVYLNAPASVSDDKFLG